MTTSMSAASDQPRPATGRGGPAIDRVDLAFLRRHLVADAGVDEHGAAAPCGPAAAACRAGSDCARRRARAAPTAASARRRTSRRRRARNSAVRERDQLERRRVASLCGLLRAPTSRPPVLRRMDERDARAVRAPRGVSSISRTPLRLERGERRVDVRDAQADVMQARRPCSRGTSRRVRRSTSARRARASRRRSRRSAAGATRRPQRRAVRSPNSRREHRDHGRRRPRPPCRRDRWHRDRAPSARAHARRSAAPYGSSSRAAMRSSNAVELAGREHVRLDVLHERPAQDLAQPPLRAGAAALAERRRRLRAKPLDRRDELGHARARRRDRAQDRRLPLAGRPGSSDSIVSIDAAVRSAPSRSALLTTKMSAISMMPALSACTSSPAPGTIVTTEMSAVRTMSTSSCPTPTVSMMTTSKPAASSTTRGLGGRAREAAEMPARRHAANEDAGVFGVRLHAHAIAQDGAAAVRARRIDGEHADRPARFADTRRSADRRACSCRRPAGR